MRNLYALLLLATTLLSSLSSCQKEPVTPREPISCTYQVLNSKGEETSVFAQGQEIFFRYTVSNSTDEDVMLRNNVYELNHFMEVFEEKSGQLAPLGTPYTSIGQNYSAYVTIAAHSIRTYTLAWVESAPSQDIDFYTPAANRPLPPGIYRTAMVPRLIWDHSPGSTTTIPIAAQNFVRRFEVR
ncbi:MAG: hypothetical protein ACRYF0_19760 [Janthinobacterium lividum]